MKASTILKATWIFLIFAFVSNLGFAFPKYTDKATILKLAKALDKGMLGKLKITSTYFKNDSPDHYYISAILSDGSTHNWSIDQIYEWTKNEKLKLQDNQILIFPYTNSPSFYILEKNKFHHLALRAKVFVKSYQGSDPLSGNVFRYQIKSFNLIAPTENAFGKNKKGYRYHYVLLLENRTRELLTYPDAYHIMKSKGLEITSTKPVLRKAYHVSKIIPNIKSTPQNGISQFGVNIVFNKPILFGKNHFPIEFYEKSVIDRKNRSTKQQFMIDITLPNSEKKFEIHSIKNLEYLQNIHIAKDYRFPKRLLLRASFKPDVVNIPPVVTKTGDRTITVTFFHMIDQTVYSRQMLLNEKQRQQQIRLSEKRVKVSKVNRNSQYGKFFIAGVDLLNGAKTVNDLAQLIDKLLKSIQNFEKAGLFSKNDHELLQALKQRNEIRKTVVSKTLILVRKKIGQEGINKAQLIQRLEKAESFTQNEKILAQIEELKLKLK